MMEAASFSQTLLSIKLHGIAFSKSVILKLVEFTVFWSVTPFGLIGWIWKNLVPLSSIVKTIFHGPTKH
jgi:hypothetical protein